jgi:hypothetical protein
MHITKQQSLSLSNEPEALWAERTQSGSIVRSRIHFVGPLRGRLIAYLCEGVRQVPDLDLRAGTPAARSGHVLKVLRGNEPASSAG